MTIVVGPVFVHIEQRSAPHQLTNDEVLLPMANLELRNNEDNFWLQRYLETLNALSVRSY